MKSAMWMFYVVFLAIVEVIGGRSHDGCWVNLMNLEILVTWVNLVDLVGLVNLVDVVYLIDLANPGILMITTLGRLREYNDLNDVTMAHEDDTQVGQTRS